MAVISVLTRLVDRIMNQTNVHTFDRTTDSLEAIRNFIAAIGPGMVYSGTVTAVPFANGFTIPTLAGLGAGKFTDVVAPWWAIVFRDFGGGGLAPQGEMQTLTAYVTATGDFTAPGFGGGGVNVGDEIIILNPILVAIGRRIDAAAADSMANLATDSLVAEVKRILIRMSGVGIFSADIQGAARTELDTMLAQIATYFVAAGAAFGPTVNNAAVASLAAAWSALNDMLVSATGIANWLARALPANGVSLSEVVKYNAEVKPEWGVPTAATHTTTTATEETILTTGYTVPGLFYFDLDLVNLAAGDVFTIRVYKRIDGVNYRLKSEQGFPDAQRLMAYEIEGLYFDSGQNIRVTIQRNSATNRAFPYRYNVLRQPVA